MTVIIADENNRLTPEIISLMDQAADEAVSFEFADELEARGLTPADLDGEIAVTIVEDDEIQSLNNDYRGIDKVTDVLSFPQFAEREELFEDLIIDEEGVACLVGDVVICADQAERQAAEYGTGIVRETVYLFVHSLFHLFGYDHEDEEERKVMRAREDAVLSSIGI